VRVSAALSGEVHLYRQCAMTKNSNRKWSPKDDERLLVLAATGKPHVFIGAVLKRSTVSVTGRLGILRARAAEELASDQREIIEKLHKPLN
jgi:hypothetical protein